MRFFLLGSGVVYLTDLWLSDEWFPMLIFWFVFLLHQNGSRWDFRCNWEHKVFSCDQIFKLKFFCEFWKALDELFLVFPVNKYSLLQLCLDRIPIQFNHNFSTGQKRLIPRTIKVKFQYFKLKKSFRNSSTTLAFPFINFCEWIFSRLQAPFA